MSIRVTIGGVDHTSDIDQGGMHVQQILGTQRDTATLFYKKYGSKSYTPSVLDSVLIQDIDDSVPVPAGGVGYGSSFYGLGYGVGYGGASSGTKILGGRISAIRQTSFNPADGIVYELDCVDYGIDLDSELASQEYDNMTVHDIIADLAANFATGFTANSVSCAYVVANIVLNQVPISQAIKKLADLVQYNWYVDADKDIHFFPKYTSLAPFNLTDSSGNCVNSRLQTSVDGTQLANQIKVRGGTY